MKILHVMASCSHASGVAQVMMSYYRRIYDSVTFDFLLLWDEEDSFKEEISALGGSVYFTGKPALRDIPDYCRKIDRFFREREGEYDAVHLHELYLNPFIFPLAKKYGIGTRIAHSHTTKLSYNKIRALRNRILYLPVNHLATHFFACSKAAGRVAFGRKTVDEGRLYVVNNAIDPQLFAFSPSDRENSRKEFGLRDEFVVGHVGRLSPEKNHAFLLAVFREVLEARPDARLLLVGDGSLMNSLREQASRTGIRDSVIFAGQRSDVGALLSAMDCFVLPSLSEGLGIVLIEAQCNALPCVASDAVPEEARILRSFRTLSLNDDSAQWTKAILGAGEREKEAVAAITAAGFNIFDEAPKLLEKYLSITGERNE